MSVIDAHCHVWERWPYTPPVPDPQSRARLEQLLYEMDRAGVAHSVIVCAAIGDNPANTAYAFEAADRHPGRFTVFPDIECRWADSYHTPGAADRLRAAAARWPMRGFAHYLDEAEDAGWLTGEEGRAFFGAASELGLIASLSVLPHQMAGVRRLARTFPALRLICHHYAHLGPRWGRAADLVPQVTAAAAEPNIFVKLSGMGNVAGPDDEYPYASLHWITAAIIEAFGPDRLVWGSDYPVSRRHMTYAQTRALVERHAPLDEAARAGVMGGNMGRLLADAGLGR